MSTTLRGAPAIRTSQPTADMLVAFLKANAVFGETVRFQELDRREAFLRGKQYAHQKIDWNGRNADQIESISAEAVFPPGFVPSTEGADGKLARDKRPTAPTNKAKVINRRYTGLLFSETRRPDVRVMGDADTEAFLEAVREAAQFWPTMRSARKLGGGIGSVAVTVHLRDGEFAYEVHNTKNVTPVWRDPRKRIPSAFLIMWRYQRLENVYDEKHKFAGTKPVDWLYRRIVTEQSDIVYRDIKLEDATDENWEVLMQVDHGLGFFPGVWIQNTAESADMDGECDCEGAFQTIDTNDRLLAQANYGALNNLDPTMVLAYDSKKVGALGAAGGVVTKGSDNALHVGDGGHADYMEITGAGIDVALKLSDRLEKNVCDMTGAVFLDDKEMAAAQSAKAIEFRFAPMLEVADDLRAQYGGAVIGLMRITERMVRAFIGKTIELPPDEDGTPRVGKFSLESFVLPPRQLKVRAGGVMVDSVVPHKLGPGGYITLKWGPYFSPTLDDNQKTVAIASAANAGGFVAKATAGELVAPIFGVSDVEGEVAKARDEGTEDAEKALAGAMGGVHAERALAEGTAEGNDVFGKPVGERTGPAGEGGRA